MVLFLYTTVGCRVMLLKNFDIKKGFAIPIFWCSLTRRRLKSVVGKRICVAQNRIWPQQNNSAYYYFSQFPLRLAYFLTGHEVQSLTLKGPVAVCGPNAWINSTWIKFHGCFHCWFSVMRVHTPNICVHSCTFT